MPFADVHECLLPGECKNFEFKNSLKKYFIVDPKSRLTKLTLKSSSAIDAEIVRHVSCYPRTIHPFSLARKYWEYLIILTFMAFFLCMPYHISFVFGRNEELNSLTAILELITDFIFIMDIAVNFFTGIYDEKTDMIELSLKEIGKNYLLSFFAIDLVTSLPNNFLFLFMHTKNNETITIYNCIVTEFVYYDTCLLDTLDILKYIKILRFLTFLLYIENFFKRNGFRTFYLKVTKLLVTVILAFHFLACSEFLIERLLHGADMTADSRKDYWGEKLEVWNTTSTFELYLHTLYRTFYLLSNFSYSIPIHSTITSHTISTIFVLLGYIMSIYLISHAYMLMQIIYSPSMKYQQNRYQLQEFMRYKQVPTAIQQRLLNHYDYKLQKQSYNESDIHKIVGDKLFEDISFASHLQILKSVNFIRILPDYLIKKLAVTLSTETFLTNDVISRPGQGNAAMHIITYGTVAMFNVAGDELRRFEDNDFFGDFFDTKLSENFIVALETTETYSLAKEDFLTIMQEADPVYYERAKLVACNVIDLDGLFESLIERVVLLSSRSKETVFVTHSVTEVTKKRSRHVSLFP